MIYHFGEVIFDSSLYSVQRGGQSIRLRPKAFRMCLYLLEHRDRVVSREELCAQVWGERFVSQATLEGVIRSVREALGDSGRRQGIIQTLRGYGYRFVAGIEERTAKDVEEKVPQRWESLSASVPADEVQHPEPEMSADSLERPMAIGAGGPSVVGADRWLGWWPLDGWKGLAVVALMLAGAFGVWWATSREAMGPPEKVRIAVLPFIDLSAEATPDYIADGMTEEAIAQLSQIPGLTVIARTSVMRYKGSLKDVTTIGRELGVGSLLEGSIRKMDKQVRVSVQLIDVASQGHRWSQEYIRDITGLYATHSDIATRLAQALRVQLAAKHASNRLDIDVSLSQGPR